MEIPVHMQKHIHIHVHMHMQIHIRTCIHVRIHMNIHTHMHRPRNRHIHKHVHIYTYIHTYMSTYLHIWYTYTHTSTIMYNVYMPVHPNHRIRILRIWRLLPGPQSLQTRANPVSQRYYVKNSLVKMPWAFWIASQPVARCSLAIELWATDFRAGVAVTITAFYLYHPLLLSVIAMISTTIAKDY